MSREYVTGIDLRTREGYERRLDITPDWQVWVDDRDLRDNLAPLAGVMLAGVISNVDSLVPSEKLYKDSYDEYIKLKSVGAEEVVGLNEESESRLSRVFNQHFRKLYTPASGVLKGNIISITSLPKKGMFLVSRDMSDSEHIVSIITSSELAGEDQTNNETIQKIAIKQLVDRRYIKRDFYTPSKEQLKETKQETQQPNNTSERSKRSAQEAQTEFSDYNDYADEMIKYIEEIGKKPFGVEDLLLWARENRYNPNPGEIERIVLLRASRSGLVKKTTVYESNKHVKEKWVLLKK